MKAIRLLLADDHPLVVDGLAAALERAGFRVVAKVNSAGQIATAFVSAKPDVAVLDVRFGREATGLEAARELLKAHAKAKIVIYSQFDDDELVQEAYRAGCSAFVTKDRDAATLGAAIVDAHAGKRYFLPEIAERLAVLGLEQAESPQSVLDERDLQVFAYLARGLTNAEIAVKMGLSVKTISTISQSIKERFGVQRPAEITLLAYKYKIIKP
jgi:two-component system, NarL family, invasion response regulator UvrY